MVNPTRNKDIGKDGNPGQFASPGLNTGLLTRDTFTDPYTTPQLPTYDQLGGRRTPVNHPTVGAISIAHDPRTPEGTHPDYVEVAFFDKNNNWIADAPVPGFEAWDEGCFGDTRVYPGVPFGYVQAWVSADGDRSLLEDRVASELHDEWRSGRAQLDGTYEPRWKDDGDGGQVDIANTAYGELPERWKAENRASAQSVVRRILNDPYADDDDLAEGVHRDWMTRNSEWAPPELLVDYGALPAHEQHKDLAVVWAARRVLGIPAD